VSTVFLARIGRIGRIGGSVGSTQRQADGQLDFVAAITVREHFAVIDYWAINIRLKNAHVRS
jgi:hypothetical protein